MTITDLTRGHSLLASQMQDAPGDHLLDDQRCSATHQARVVEPLSLDHAHRDSHERAVEGPSSERQPPRGSHSAVAFGTNSREANLIASTIDASPHGPLFPAANDHSATISRARSGHILFDPYLCLLSDSLDDIEALRIATDNRVRMLTRSESDSDGEIRGLGLDARSPQVARALALAESIQALEHKATLDLQRAVKATPFWSWIERSKGIGAKQAARLLAVIGDPYWNDLHERPRTVSELWAYAGYAVHGGRADRRQKGVKANWNDKAKSRAFLMAQSCVKSGGGYRDAYDAARTQYGDTTHPHDCVRCGPAGKPALAGTPLSAGHQHARALRIVAKTILRDLWIEAKSIHEGAEQ